MTEEEIEKKAEDWYKNTVKINEWNEKGVCTTYMPNATTGFIAGVKLIQKENAELTEKMADLEKENKEYESEARECNIRLDEMTNKYVPRLVQAKEIIRKMLFALSDNRGSFMSNPYYDLEKQAEQFLKENE